MTEYGPVHPDRYQLNGIQPKKGTVIHTSESRPNSYPGLRTLVTRKGDKPSPSRPGQFYGASYHALTRNDPEATYDQILTGEKSSYSAPPLNQSWWHICIPANSNALGKPGDANYRPATSREDWLEDPLLRSGILAVGKFIVDHGTKPVYCHISDLQAGFSGYTSHNNVSLAFRKSDHTDPGKNFPWDVLAQDIEELLNPKTGEKEVLKRIHKPTWANAPGDLPWLGTFDSGTVRPMISYDIEPEEKNPKATDGTWPIADPGQYQRICDWAKIPVKVV